MTEKDAWADAPLGVCDVHDLVDGDKGERRVLYCPKCDANICKECAPQWDRRAEAWAIRKGRKLMSFFGKKEE